MNARSSMLAPLMLFALLPPFAAGANEVKHRFLCVDNYGKVNRLIYIDQSDPARSWTAAIPGPRSRDLQIIDGGKVLVSHFTGAAEYRLADGKKGWSVEGYREVQTARRMENGHTLLGANTKAGIAFYEVDHTGREARRLVLPGLTMLRLVRRLANGRLLLTVGRPYRVIEVDDAGKIAWRAKLPGKGYKAIRLANGNTLCTTGNYVKVVEMSPAGEVVRSVGGKAEHPNLGLDFFSGFDLLPNGHVVAANWLGHGKLGTGPHLVEFDRENRCVWQWEDHQAARTITNVLVLDDVEPERAR